MTRQRSLAVFIVMLLLISLATPVYAAPSVSVGYTRPEPGQEVTFSVSGAPTGNSAWVGIFPYEPMLRGGERTGMRQTFHIIIFGI